MYLFLLNLLCLFLNFSVQALSAVFTSDKLLLTVLVNVLQSSNKKVVSVDACSANAVQTSVHCSGANGHCVSKAERQLWRQKSATVPVKRSRVGCKSRRLSEPLVRTVEQMQTSQTSPDAKLSQVVRTHCDIIGNSRLDGVISKPSSSRSNPVWLSSTAPSHSYVAAAACTSIEPLVVNPVYGSDDCSTLKSLSFEKKDCCLHAYSSALTQVLHGSQNRVSESVSDQCTSLSSADEEKRGSIVPVSPRANDSATGGNVTLPEVQAGDCDVSAGSYGYSDASCQGSETNDDARNVCAQFGYRKVCVYLHEGTWRHSPHSLHCIRIDDNISLVVLCEVMSFLLFLTGHRFRFWCIRKHLQTN